MDAERWQKLQDLFMAAHAVQGEQRERLLADHARIDPVLVEEARLLLAADARAGVMDVLGPRLASVASVLQDDRPGRIGAYHVVSELGRGGMGVVYLADRADGEFQQRVAIKLIGTSDADDPLHQRFLAERQILAGLIHPNIARLLDGGLTADGRPYLVMEYVEGLPITTYCDQQRLDLRGRLRLFGDVCAAVQHAHQNLVIHRDLKPSNILVSSDGRVHLLDFGIAKLIDPTASASPAPVTRVESRMMTPEYASPEQVRGESLGTTSDIYSLGVLLYELLCGCAPYQLTTRSPLEVATAVCEQDPLPPSVRATQGYRLEQGREEAEAAASSRGTSADRLPRLLEGDLDGIVLMAMRKEPARRYASADMLRQDIDRHLAGLPVLAHRGSRRYRVGKFLRRHRAEAIAATLVLAALVTGLSAAVVQGRRASRERDRAEQALAESTGVTNFLLELFQTGDPGETPPARLTALDLLQRGAQRADELSGQPLVRARLLDVVGQMSLHLGRLDEAQRRLEQAVALRRAAPGNTPADLAGSLIHLARVHRTRNEYERARALVNEALDLRRQALPADHPDTAEALYELGWLTFGTEQERLYRQALTLLAERPSTAARRVTLLQALSTNLRRQGRLAEAIAADKDALSVAERSFGPDHHTTGYAMIHLADHVADIEQDHAAAERLYRRGLEVMTRHFGDDSTRLLHGLNSLARLLGSRGDDEAEIHYRRALGISQSATGPEHPRVADQLAKLAGELARQGRLSEAETLVRQSLDLSIRTLGPRHQLVTTSRMPLLAEILDRQRRHREADETYRLAFEQVQRPSNVLVGQMERDYGLMLLRRGDHASAESHLLQSLSLLEQAYQGSAHPNVHETKRALMDLYRLRGKPDFVERYRVPPGRFIAY
jgi:serine/threonine-protein kinase